MRGIAEHDFHPRQFPVVIRFLRKSDGEVVWERTLERPQPGEKHALQIPALQNKHGPVVCEIETADGFVERSE